MIIIGVDPGASGGLAIWNNGIKIIKKCPNNVENMSDLVNSAKNTGYVENYNVCAYIEHVHAFPTDARSAAFKFGVNYGKWLGILGVHKIKTVMVSPQKWQKYWQRRLEIKFPKEKTKRKRRMKEIASNYTDKQVTLYVADAILIALYGLSQEGSNIDSQEIKG